MKILYTESLITKAGEQVILYDCQINNSNKNYYQRLLMDCYPQVANAYEDILLTINNKNNHLGEYPTEGDVIWSHIPGNNKFIVAAIMYDKNGNLTYNRFSKMFNSIQKKMDSLKCTSIAMPLIGINNNLNDWINIYPIIENEFNTQVTVYIPDNKTLYSIIDLLSLKQVNKHS